MDENLIGAKKEIETILYDKLGETLNEKYKDLAPTLLEKKKRKPDFLDFDSDGDEDEDMVDALDDEYKKKKKKTNEDSTPAQETLRPNGAGKDEPGDISKKKAVKVGTETVSDLTAARGTGGEGY